MSDAATTASIPVTVIPPAATIAPPFVNNVLPPLQTINVSAPPTTLPVMSNQADLMAVLQAMQQSIERLQAAVNNPPPRPQSEPLQPPNEQHVTDTRKQPIKHRLDFHEEPGTLKTPERIQVEDGQSDDERRNPRSRRQEESSYEAYSTKRDSYYNPGEHRAERYTNAPVIVGRPFTEEVDYFPTPQNFKMPPCESYDGTGDPMEHLARFTSGMNLHLVPDQIMCRAFLVTLKGAAHVWFQHLAPHSISCWAQLAESFCSNFLTSQIQRKNSSALFRIIQGPKESLKSYYARFNSKKLLIDHLDPGVTFAAMARGVRPGTPLRFSLNKRPPENMADLLDRVEKYLRSEEDSTTSQYEDTHTGQKRRDRSEGKVTDDPKRSRTMLPKSFSPLNASRGHILNQIKGQSILRWPKPMRGPVEKRDSQLYCHFHKDHGHTTDECKVLQCEIENLIAKGHLKQFIKTNDRQQSGKRGNQQRTEEAPMKDPHSSRKAYARQVNLTQGPTKRTKVSTSLALEFDNADLDGVSLPHDDALVITLHIDAFQVKRILVDTGSLADIIFEDAFNQMGISTDRVKPIASSLYGFTGASALVKGIIPLTVIAGEAPRQAVHTLDFLIVSVKSSYNGILGQTGLNKLQAVASTYHLIMKFPTSTGVGLVKGDQILARRCYVVSCKTEEALSIDDQRDEKTLRCAEPVEALTSFDKLKEYLTSPPLFSKPIPGEDLFLYLAVSESAVSAVLIREQDGRQLPIYYVSKVLQGAEQRYSNTEKLVFALLIATRNLRPYFQSHTIIVLTDKPLRRILHRPDLLGRLVPWSIELGEFDIRYKPRPSVKGQALADFIVECTFPIEDKEPLLPAQPELFTWTLFVDGSSNTNGREDVLYKRSFTLPYLRCLTPLEADYALREVHEGICGQHLGGRALEHKVLRHEYYWPTMHRDALDYTKKCDACQRFSSIPRQSPSLLTSLSSSIPFAMWGMDIMVLSPQPQLSVAL
ncbi:hypothetical protein RJ639_010088 [Escallonia herrerae]|uniref:Uncharacterized protein n=1 Tax=Escallonia herrerae TaxID=1293975 RepID=A0AA89AU89_9ASTE|nr:hypothetical protein RJ639_010088 [Escallonia herrerae]